MARVSYPLGHTTASRLKTLVLWLERERGKADADALVRGVDVDPDYLDDETRPLPVATWLRALEAFASRFGKDTILETWTAVLDAQNLGVWTRVLRGTTDVDGALRQLDALASDEGRTTHWETLASRPGRWHGRVVLTYDPSLEREGLCSLARAAELAAVPAMFGLGRGEVEILPAARSTTASRTGATGEEYVVRWRAPAVPIAIPVVGGAVIAGAAAGAMLDQRLYLPATVAIASVAALLATIDGRVREQRRKADSHAQMTRIRALERSVALKEEREKAAIGFFEGSVIAGKYRLGPRLGAGASGVIHRAMRLADNVPVAIKLLRAAVAHDTVASDRLRREAEALGLAWHPNVVEIYEHDHLPDGTTYLVMEHLEGESLATRLTREHRLPGAALLPIALQVCEALGAVHAAGIVHRDIKPSNIFLVASAEEPRPVEPTIKLLDFGIARVEWAETRLTNMGSPLGTPGYMSPEQESGGEIDARSDLFALGAVLYECLTGAPPPPTVSDVWVAARPVDGSRPSVGRAIAAIPLGWQRIIDRAMAPLPQERFPDARAMREAVLRLAETAEASGAGEVAGAV